MFQQGLTRLRAAVAKASFQIVALRSANVLVNPLSQLLLIAKFGIASYGVYLAAQALASALERLVSFGVADFAVREFINHPDQRSPTMQALLLSRALAFIIVTAVIALIFFIFSFEGSYVIYFVLFWCMAVFTIANKIFDSFSRALRHMDHLRIQSVGRLGIDITALLAVAVLDVGYVGFIITRLLGFSLLTAKQVFKYHRYLHGTWTQRTAIVNIARSRFQLSAFFGTNVALRELGTQWLLVAYSFMVPSAMFGLVGLAWRLENVFAVGRNNVVHVITMPKLVAALNKPAERFFDDYRLVTIMHLALGVASTVALLALLVLAEWFVLEDDQSFGIWFLLSMVVYGVVTTMSLIPGRLILAVGRLREFTAKLALAVVAGYGALFAVGLFHPFYALNVARIVYVVGSYAASWPIMQRLLKERFGRTASSAGVFK